MDKEIDKEKQGTAKDKEKQGKDKEKQGKDKEKQGKEKEKRGTVKEKEKQGTAKDKESQGTAAKLKRKLSRKAGTKSPKTSRENLAAPPGGARSLTLPSNVDPAMIGIHQSHSEGLFTKLRRRFRFGGKGKYDLSFEGDLPESGRPRRRSDDARPQHDGKCLNGELDDANYNSVAKANSVKTPRKAKSDKEEVILIRKDKRVSVICKGDNGESQVIFSNVDNSDIDSLEAFGGMEEDPYATISSVNDEINRQHINKRQNSKKKNNDDVFLPPPSNAGPGKSGGNSVASAEESPYAKIDPSRKKNPGSLQSSLQAVDFNRQTKAMVRSRIEPDYETLDDVKQRRDDFAARGSIPSPSSESVSTGSNLTPSIELSGDLDLDPDYESLEDVRQRCASGNFSAATAPKMAPVPSDPILCLNSAYQSSIPTPGALSLQAISPHSPSNSSNKSGTSARQVSPMSTSSLDRRKYPASSPSTAFSQGSSRSSPQIGQRYSLAPSPMSPGDTAPLAPSIDSSLPHDLPAVSQEEECLYDNPNVILRKHGSDAMSGSGGRRANTMSEPPILKTPAEEELVEKLSALLAPPLPLRNYQKDEIHSRIDRNSSRSCSGSARHSWSSQTNRHTEHGESSGLKNSDKSASSSVSHSRENLFSKPSTISAQDRYEKNFRSQGTDLQKLKEAGTLDRCLRRLTPSPVVIAQPKNLSDRSDINSQPVASKVNDVLAKGDGHGDLSALKPPENVSSTAEKADSLEESSSAVAQSPESEDIVTFSRQLAEQIIKDAVAQYESSLTQNEKDTNVEEEAELMQGMNAMQISSSKPSDSKDDQNVHPVKDMAAISVENHVNRKDVQEKETTQSGSKLEKAENFTYLFQNVNTESGPVVHDSASVSTSSVHRSQADVVTDPNNSSLRNLTAPHENQNANEMEMYKAQGARPKIKPFMFKGSQTASQESHRDLVETKKATDRRHACQGTSLATNRREDFCHQSSEDVHTWDDAMSPSFSDVDFHHDVMENILPGRQNLASPDAMSDRDANLLSLEALNNMHIGHDADSKVHETIYVDTDSENEDGIELHEHRIIHVKRDFSISKVAKPVLYANPRLLENVISGRFKVKSSLDPHYLLNGVFRWGRYFPDLGDNRQVVEAKLKHIFHFVRRMLIDASKVRETQYLVKELQHEMDRMQLKIEKRLRAVQDLPTFQDVRLKLLKTDQIDHWEPETPKGKYSGRSVRQGELENTNDELHFTPEEVTPTSAIEKNADFIAGRAQSDKTVDLVTTGVGRCATDMMTSVDAEDLHSEEPPGEVADVFCDQGSYDQSTLDIPGKPLLVLEKFQKLCHSSLKCKKCGEVEEGSDSEDEMIAVETYVRVSSSLSSQAASSHNVRNISYCRALHGELAYTARIRKSRAARKILSVPGPDDMCAGSESHLSWNNWCWIDALFKKLIPHISPRLDFQYLLKTYAEFKFFILKGRKRNLERKGCFRRKFLPNNLKCCRFEEFVFLKIIRDELRHFSQVIDRSKTTRALFLEEGDIRDSLLSLLKLTLRNIHKMQKSMSKELVEGIDNELESGSSDDRLQFRHKAFKNWKFEQLSASDTGSTREDEGNFHFQNFDNFRTDTVSQALKDWKSPQDFVHDPNVLVTCRTVFAHTDARSIEIAGMRGTEEPKPLQEREDFLESMEQLQLREWYWGPISYEQAAIILRDKEDGSFLVRDSSDQKYLLSLSFKSLGEVHHTRIEHAKGLFSFWSQPESHGKARICEFIERSIQNSRDGKFLYFLRPSARGTPPLPIRLLTPVSRSFRVATLKHLSRFVVRQTVRKDHLDYLPVPETVKRYLKDKQYYVEILEDDQWAFEGDYIKS